MKIRNLITTMFGYKLGPEVELPDPWMPAKSILIVEADPLKPDTREIIIRLDEIASLKVGDPWPKSFGGTGWSWGPPLTRLLLDAKVEILALRLGLTAAVDLLADEIKANKAAGVRSEDGT